MHGATMKFIQYFRLYYTELLQNVPTGPQYFTDVLKHLAAELQCTYLASNVRLIWTGLNIAGLILSYSNPCTNHSGLIPAYSRTKIESDVLQIFVKIGAVFY